jgi:hypothetical protein
MVQEEEKKIENLDENQESGKNLFCGFCFSFVFATYFLRCFF